MYFRTWELYKSFIPSLFSLVFPIHFDPVPRANTLRFLGSSSYPESRWGKLTLKIADKDDWHCNMAHTSQWSSLDNINYASKSTTILVPHCWHIYLVRTCLAYSIGNTFLEDVGGEFCYFIFHNLCIVCRAWSMKYYMAELAMLEVETWAWGGKSQGTPASVWNTANGYTHVNQKRTILAI